MKQNNKAAHALSEEEIHALLARVEKKDQQAYERLYYAYYSRVSNFLRPKLFGQEDAVASIAQEVLFEVWHKPGTFNGQSQFATFLFGIAKNKFLQHRDRERQYHPDLYMEAADDEEDSDPMDAFPSELPSPDMQILQQEKMNVLHNCADKHLNAVQRVVLMERLVFGQNIEDIAKTMERNAVTLRRAFKVGYDKVLACVQRRLNIIASKETPDEA
ncbi:MAG: RNA polymerase sigma factor [Thiobacillus sp.]